MVLSKLFVAPWFWQVKITELKMKLKYKYFLLIRGTHLTHLLILHLIYSYCYHKNTLLCRIKILRVTFNVQQQKLAECILYSELLCYYSILLRLFSAHARRSRTPDSQMDIFAWISNIYRSKIYLWHVSYARKTQLLRPMSCLYYALKLCTLSVKKNIHFWVCSRRVHTITSHNCL